MNFNLKKLIKILGDGAVHSGTELGEQLSLTRGGIWKLVKKLESLGLEVLSGTNKGYQIPGGVKLLSESEIKSCIDPKLTACIQEMFLFDEIDSTNEYLLKHPAIPENKAVICLAESQTAGRGRFGRTWVSPYARNLYMSLLWRFPLDSSQLSGLSLVVGLSLAEALKNYGITEGIQLKWPNDVLWENKKLGGCLIETYGEANGACHAVIGVGLNMSMPPEYEKEVDGRSIVDVRQIIQNMSDRNRLTGLVIQALIQNLQVFQKEGLSAFQKAWSSLDMALHKEVTLLVGDQTISGIHRGIDSKGCLLLESVENREVKAFSGGEVSLRFRSIKSS